MFGVKFAALSLAVFCQFLSNGLAAAAYVEPEWWDVIAATYEGDDLKRCKKLDSAPDPGPARSCKRKPKTCFFGNQQCDGEAYPTETCTCANRVWTCSEVECPAPPDPNACPLVINNPAACPATNPLFSAELCASDDLIGVTCHYGSESCCDKCYPTFFCSCFQVGETFGCGYTDACYFPPCQQINIVEIVDVPTMEVNTTNRVR